MENKNRFDIYLLWRIIKLAAPYKSVFFFSAALAVILAPVSVARPRLVQEMVDEYIFKNDVPGMTKIAMIIFGVLVLETILRYLFIYATNWMGQSVIRDLRVKVFKHIISLKTRYFDTTAIGTSTTRTISDLSLIHI